MAQQQPDFAALARDSNTLVQVVGNITQQLNNLQNLPALNVAQFNTLQNNQQIQAQLRRMQNSINNMTYNVQALYVFFNIHILIFHILGTCNLMQGQEIRVQSVQETISPLP